MELCYALMTHLNRFSINFQEIDSAKAKKCPTAFKKSIFSPCSVGSVIGFLNALWTFLIPQVKVKLCRFNFIPEYCLVSAHQARPGGTWAMIHLLTSRLLGPLGPDRRRPPAAQPESQAIMDNTTAAPRRNDDGGMWQIELSTNVHKVFTVPGDGPFYMYALFIVEST